MPKIYLSIGSNCDKEIHVPSALRRLQTLFGTLQVSALYESEAVGCSGPVFHNLVVGFWSELPADVIVARIAKVETLEGRTREPGQEVIAYPGSGFAAVW
jgi:2-amino-4-hydroxy-6-hydroxymethyldihydropteridine diphosphokinase